MINPSIRECALSLLLATSTHHKHTTVGVSYRGSDPVSARVSSPHGTVIRQLRRDLEALKVPVQIVGGFAEKEVKLVAQLA